MTRSLFLLIVTLVGLAFSAVMLLAPTAFATNSGLSDSAETAFVFRALGAMILSVSIANFMVRNHPDSPTLAAILWMNVAVHVLAIGVDLLGISQGIVTLAHAVPGFVVHALIAAGAAYYARKIA